MRPSVSKPRGALDVILAALQNNASAIIEQYNDHMYWDSAGADDLMKVQDSLSILITPLNPIPRNLLSGGFFLQPTNVSNANAENAWYTDILPRVVNNVCRAYPTYISFTDLADNDSHSKCNDDKVGPQGAKYCADGGVYYLNNYISSPGDLGKPNGYDQPTSHGIDPVKIVTASAQAYRAKSIITGTPPIAAFDQVANAQVLQEISSGSDLLGSLPGELRGFRLRVCGLDDAEESMLQIAEERRRKTTRAGMALTGDRPIRWCGRMV